MYDHEISIPSDVDELYWRVYKWPKWFLSEQTKCKENLQSWRNNILQSSTNEFAKLNSLLCDVKLQISAIQNCSDPNDFIAVLKMFEPFESVENEINSYQLYIKKSCTLLKKSELTCEDLESTMSCLRNYKILWELIKDTKIYITACKNILFMDIKSDQILSKIDEWNDTSSALLKFFAKDDAQKLLFHINREIIDFTISTKVITYLRNPALADRHWEQIESITGLNQQNFFGLKLDQILPLNLNLIADFLKEISSQASIEYRPEKTIEKMKVELSSREFVLKQFDSNAVFIIENAYDSKQYLEDCLLDCEAIYQEAHNTSLKQKFDNWVIQLRKALDLISGWIKMQDLFRQLYRIVADAVFSDYLGDQSVGYFRSVIKTMEALSSIICRNKKFITLIHRSDLIENISSGLKRLHIVKEKVSSMVNAMRKTFPRFFFVSEDIVISTLSCQTVLELSEYMSYYFESIQNLLPAPIEQNEEKMKKKFSELGRMQSKAVLPKYQSVLKSHVAGLSNDAIIKSHTKILNSRYSSFNADSCTLTLSDDEISRRISIISDSGLNYAMNDVVSESIKGFEGFGGELLLFDFNLPFGRQVDKVLVAMEEQISKSLECVLLKAISVKHSTDSVESVLQIITTTPIQVGFIVLWMMWISEIEKALSDRNQTHLYSNLLQNLLDELISRLRNPLSAYERMNMETYISNLSFLMQYRFEQKETLIFRYSFLENNNLAVSIGGVGKITYGWEYVGRKVSSIVFTSAFMKSANNVLFAINEKTLPLIIGQNGLVQEISIILGMRCICISYVDLAQISNIIHGFLSSKCWLQVSNYQDSNLRSADKYLVDLHEHFTNNNHDEATYTFENIEYSVKEKFAFISARSINFNSDKIPNALRDKFRIIRTLKPDFGTVAQLAFLSYGFRQSFILSRRLLYFIKSLTSLDKSLETSITKLKSVLLSTKYIFLHCKENRPVVCLSRALFYHYKHSIKEPFFKTFLNLVSRISKDYAEDSHADRTKLMSQCADSNNVLSIGSFGENILHLLSVLHSSCREGAIIVGPQQSGKSTIIKMAQTISDLEMKKGKVKLFYLYPNAMPFSHFFVEQLNSKSEWEGIIPNMFKDAVNYAQEIENSENTENVEYSYSWLIFDGDIDLNWYQEIQDIMDKRAVSLSLPFPVSVKPIFKTGTLAYANPFVITSNQIIVLNPNFLSIENFFISKLKTLPTGLIIFKELIINIFNVISVPCLKISMPNISNGVEKIMVNSLLNLFLFLFSELGAFGYDRFTIKEKHSWITASVLFR